MCMKKIAKEILTDEGSLSSARSINVLGAITLTIVLVYKYMYIGDDLSAEVLGIYAAYCAGVYTAGKYMDRKYKDVRDDKYSNGTDERYEEYDNSDTKYSRYNDPDR